jgi:hypothetical protein
MMLNLNDQICNQVWIQSRNKLRRQVLGKVNNRIGNQVSEKLCDQSRNLIYIQVLNQIKQNFNLW